MTLNEAFSRLITQQAWYKNSGYLKEQAIRDKRIREYLRAAGWEQTQEEQWAEKDGK